jgi:lipopolysaccharide transport system ATP-binding protein
VRDIVLRAEGLGKRYRIGHREPVPTLRASLQRFLASPVTRVRAALRSPRHDELLWALRNVSFELERGQVLGVLGRNGAGKSTLLKILSRITDPTEGFAEVKGRLSSLLEVGTGFHPELTGRDNIYLNGAILGMRRAEVRAKYDSIVEFSGVERFIDTPVKRYSSGMHMRLAFAVAAHLEPDILLVDEVLAVGDAEFQKRSLGKMREVTGEGRTVVFVSHNMASIRALCQRAILLEAGHLRADGPVDQVIGDYLSGDVKATPGGEIADETPRVGTGEVRVRRVEVLDRNGQALSQAHLGEPLVVAIELDAQRSLPVAIVEVGISSLDGIRVSTAFSTDYAQPPFRLERGQSKIVVELEPWLLPGQYALDVGIHVGPAWTVDYLERIVDFEVLNLAEDGNDSYLAANVRGYVRPRARWNEVDRPEAIRALDAR